MVDHEIAQARASVIAAIARALSRIRAATNEAEWHEAVLDSGRSFAGEPAALELLGSLAAMTVPAMPPAAAAPRTVSSNGAGVLSNGAAAPPTDNPPAHRFARVRIAEIQLYHADAVKSGRAARDLYGSLQPHIDAARDEFREKFLSNGKPGENGTADYLHAQMLHALANDDATLLGPNYPGPLA